MKKIFSLIIAFMLLTVNLSFSVLSSDAAGISYASGITYKAHVEKYGWMNWVKDGQTGGSTGEAKRMEAVEIKLSSGISGGVEYQTHSQTYGWTGWKSNGEISGTTGQAKRLEAIQIKLSGQAANLYDIYYRVHVQSYGWLGWAKNGQKAGSAGESKRMEAIEICLVKKGSAAPGNTSNVYIEKRDADVLYSTHVQTYGWLDWAQNGDIGGTEGESRRMEAVKIKLSSKISGNIEYQTHSQSYGWTGWKSNGEISGTTGQAKRLEAVQIKLSGEIAKQYDVYYRVHVQSYGWLGWAKNGERAGTAGLGKRMEAMEICLVKKGQMAPGSLGNAYVEKNAVNASNLPFNVASLKTASQTDQMVVAVGDGSLTQATVYLFEKDNNYVWNMTLKTSARWGRRGISYNTVEGDNTTPAGSYDLGLAFGIKPNPGTALKWLDVNKYMYWIDDVNSIYYNQLIDSRQVPSGWSSGEHLIDYAGYYDYSINIEVNPNCIRPGSTSAIFLHCGTSETGGCVAIPEAGMITILQRLKPGAKIVIAENRSAVYNY